MTLSIHGILASRALRPLWAAAELGLPFEHIRTLYAGGGTRTPEFLALNPNGHIPVIVDHRDPQDGGEVVVWESMACALYIARHHGAADGTGLTPTGPAEDAQALRWSFWTMTEVESDALTVLSHRLTLPAERRKPELAEAAERRLRVPLRVLEQALQAQHARGQAHLAADRFTVADLCVASVLLWLRSARAVLDEFPTVSGWLQGCVQRPAYRQLREQHG